MNVTRILLSQIVVLLALLDSAGAGESAPTDPNQREAKESFLDMSIEELMDVEVSSTAALTQTSARLAPATVTTITREQIRQSGARSLYELLEIYVPNLQVILHDAKLRHMGLRGIISNRDDKYLLLVNGHMMNEHTDFGAISERDLPMLADIHHIDVIRGTGSALFGPGALSMVINITTDNAETFQGLEVNQRVGGIEEFYATEFKYGHKFDNGAGLFVYGGIADYPGASGDDSPVVYGASTIKAGRTYSSNQKVADGLENYNEQFAGTPKVKLHAEYTHDDVDLGFRYTQGGEYVDLGEQAKIDIPFGEGYRQGMLFWGYRQELSSDFAIKYDVDYLRTEIQSAPYGQSRALSYAEDEYFGKVMATWDINKKHHLALGGSWAHDEFGLSPTGSDNANYMYVMFNNVPALNKVMPRWDTDLGSVMGEYQWNISDSLTSFVGARMDYHTFTDLMFSPRFSLIYTPTDKDTFKFMTSSSHRMNTAADMKDADLLGKSPSAVETLDTLEIRYERRFSSNFWTGMSVFKHKQDLIGWGRTATDPNGTTTLLGTEKVWGVELETTYLVDKFRFDISHGYTQLLSFDLAPGITSAEDTAAPMGYGNDLANWFNQISKARVHYKVDDRWSVDSSLVVYWCNPGGEDYAEWRNSVKTAYYDLKADKAFDPSYYLNAGVQYSASKNLTLRFDAYDILGWFEQDLNKRREGFNTDRPGMYRIMPPSVGFGIVYRF
ncbi:MAG: TonB-dependent receptor plug domain-containing protein [Phycisphaerae bacterium]|nr:TonB-dependent receptor plug domain-containing protein [Phycisphaerae bacterium]